MLSKPIIDKLYPNKEVISKCPEIKKIQEKPQVKQSLMAPSLEKFINTAFTKSTGDTRVVSISKDKAQLIVLTTSHYCEIIRDNHEDSVMSYIIKKNIITQKCPKCKSGKSREHKLNGNVLKTLKQ